MNTELEKIAEALGKATTAVEQLPQQIKAVKNSLAAVEDAIVLGAEFSRLDPVRKKVLNNLALVMADFKSQLAREFM